MRLNTYKILKLYSPIYKKPNAKHSIETEGIFGEIFLVEKIKKDFAFGVLYTDNYKGWIKLNDLKEVNAEPNHTIVNVNTLIKERPDLKSKTLGNLSFGSQIYITKKKENWSSFQFYYQNKIKKAYIYTNHIHDLSKKLNKCWVDFAENFINVPYKWGGRSFFGIDCSSLIQLSIMINKNKFFPRNSNDQYLFSKKHGEITTNFRRGTLVFWEGHVGVMICNEKILHANAYHMKVQVEPFFEAKKRIEKNYTFLNFINLNY